MIKTPDFWTQDRWQSRLLRPVSFVYGGIAGACMLQPARYHAKAPVIAIGNFTAGGAGKTPTAIAITQIAIGLGFSPIVLMRGYGGNATGPVLVDAARDTPHAVGDEALMIARTGVSVIVARDRAAGADFAVSCGSDLLILDDGFQSPALAKDLSLVVIDSVYGIGNGQVIPAGPLRAPLAIQMAALDALVVISNGTVGSAATRLEYHVRAAGKPVLTAQIEPDEHATDFHGRRVVAFAGIGRPAKLAEGLRARGALVEDLVSFPDHHCYTPAEARSLMARVEGTDRLLVTTAKDMARLTGVSDPSLTALAARTEVAGVRLRFDDAAEVCRLLKDRLGRPGGVQSAAKHPVR